MFKDSGNLYLTEINAVTTRRGRQSMALDYMFQAFEWLGILYCEPFSGSTNYRMFLGSLDRLIPSLSGSLGIQLCWVSHHVFLAWWNVPRYSGRALRNQHICTLATGLQGLGLYRECYWDQVSCESSVFQAYRCAMWMILCRKNYFGRKLIRPGPIASTLLQTCWSFPQKSRICTAGNRSILPVPSDCKLWSPEGPMLHLWNWLPQLRWTPLMKLGASGPLRNPAKHRRRKQEIWAVSLHMKCIWAPKHTYEGGQSPKWPKS